MLSYKYESRDIRVRRPEDELYENGIVGSRDPMASC